MEQRVRARLVNWLGRCRDRGAALPEYALIVATVAVASIGGLQYVSEQSDTALDNQVGCVETGAGCVGAAGGGGGSTTTTTGPSTSVPASTSTTAAVTSTTGAPSTTAPPATTTTTAPRITITAQSRSARDDGNGYWTARFRFIATRNGNRVSGVSMSGRYTDNEGETRNWNCSTNSSGECNLNVDEVESGDPLRAETYVVAAVQNVSHPDWDGSAPSSRCDDP